MSRPINPSKDVANPKAVLYRRRSTRRRTGRSVCWLFDAIKRSIIPIYHSTQMENFDSYPGVNAC